MHASARLIPTAFIEERGMSLLSPLKIEEDIIERIFDPADAGAPKTQDRRTRGVSGCSRRAAAREAFICLWRTSWSCRPHSWRATVPWTIPNLRHRVNPHTLLARRGSRIPGGSHWWRVRNSERSPPSDKVYSQVRKEGLLRVNPVRRDEWPSQRTHRACVHRETAQEGIVTGLWTAMAVHIAVLLDVPGIYHEGQSWSAKAPEGDVRGKEPTR